MCLVPCRPPKIDCLVAGAIFCPARRVHKGSASAHKPFVLNSADLCAPAKASRQLWQVGKVPQDAFGLLAPGLAFPSSAIQHRFPDKLNKHGFSKGFIPMDEGQLAYNQSKQTDLSTNRLIDGSID
jgi:hypothetical protein